MKKLFVLVTTLIVIGCSLTFASDIEHTYPEQIAYIRSAISSTDVNIGKSCMIRSHNHRQGYYVGVQLYYHDINKRNVGVWFTNVRKGQPYGLLLSVNNIAYIYSQMGKACRTKVRACPYDKETRMIEAYLK